MWGPCSGAADAGHRQGDTASPRGAPDPPDPLGERRRGLAALAPVQEVGLASPATAAPALRVPASPLRPCNGATALPARRPRAGQGRWHRVLAAAWLCWSAPVLCHAGGFWREQVGIEATVHRAMCWSGDASGLPEEGFPRKSEAPGLGPCPLPATVAILALLPFNYRPRLAWPCVPLHYVIAIGAAPPSRPTPADN